MDQLVLDIFRADILPKGYLPCSNPELIEGYVAIADIFKGDSVDFRYCYTHRTAWCEHRFNWKRGDLSYLPLLEHFRNGGSVNQPLNWVPGRYEGEDRYIYGNQQNGHHRLVAAYDAGFTHVPYNSARWGDHRDWEDTPNSPRNSWE